MLAGSAAVSSTESTPISSSDSSKRRVARLERRVPRLVGQRHGDVGGRGQPTDQVQLISRQVVEPVEEDRPAPELALGPEQLDGVAGDAVGVDRFEPVAHPRVAGEEGGDVAKVGRALERAGSRFHVRRLETRALQLVEQPLEGEWEAGPQGRAAQRPQLRAPLGHRGGDGAEALRRGQERARGGAPRRGHGPEQAAEGHHVGSEHRPVRAELLLEGIDVVEGRHDEDRIAIEHGDQATPDAAGAAGIRWSVDQFQGHRGERSSIGLPAALRNTANAAKRPPICRLPPSLD